MKEKYLINARIIDPKNNIDEIGGLIIDEKGNIKATGKKVVCDNLPSKSEKIDLKNKILIPGLVDMRVFVGEPGYEYKENFRTLSNAALSGGVTSVVSMPNTLPVIDNISMVDFLKRRGRDKSKINIYPTASLTKNTEGKQMTEFGLLQRKGISAFTDGDKAVEARHTNGTSAGVESGFGSPHVVAEATSCSPIPPPLAPADNVPNHSSRNGMSPEAAHPPLPLKSPLFGPDPQPRPEVKNASFFDEDDAL